MRIKIVVYKDNLTGGRGADCAVCAMCGYLAEDYEVTLLTAIQGVPSFPIDSRVRFMTLESTEERRVGLKKVFQQCNPMVVIATGANEVLDLAAAFPGKSPFPWQTIFQFHVYPAYVFKRKRFIRNLQIRRAIRRCAAVQTLLPSYEFEVRRLVKYTGPVVAIGNALPPTSKRTEFSHGLSDQRLIIYPAALNEDKRQELLIRAMSYLSNRQLRLELYGDGKPRYVNRLKSLARNLGVADRVQFMGYVKDLAPIYARASIVAFPSRVEGFPMTFLEAAQYKRRIVACSDCAASCALVPQLGGLLSEPNAISLAAAIDAATAMSQLTSIPTGVEEYRVENIAVRWRNLIEKVIT